MHLNTVVRVMAETEEEAIDRVKSLLAESSECIFAPFDWVAEDETKISAEVKTDEDFLKLRDIERQEYALNMKCAEEVDSEQLKGFYLRRAGECLNDDIFWSTERVQYTIDWHEGSKAFYVDTDRHC